MAQNDIMNNEIPRKLIWANYLMLVFLAIQCVSLPFIVSESVNNFRLVANQSKLESFTWPLLTQLFLSTPIWVYFICSYCILVLSILKEFLCKINTKLFLNAIGLIIIQGALVLYMLGVVRPFFIMVRMTLLRN